MAPMWLSRCVSYYSPSHTLSSGPNGLLSISHHLMICFTKWGHSHPQGRPRMYGKLPAKWDIFQKHYFLDGEEGQRKVEDKAILSISILIQPWRY